MLDLRTRFIEKIEELCDDGRESEAARKVKAILDLHTAGDIDDHECQSKFRMLLDTMNDDLMTKAQVIGMLGGHENL